MHICDHYLGILKIYAQSPRGGGYGWATRPQKYDSGPAYWKLLWLAQLNWVIVMGSSDESTWLWLTMSTSTRHLGLGGCGTRRAHMTLTVECNTDTECKHHLQYYWSILVGSLLSSYCTFPSGLALIQTSSISLGCLTVCKLLSRTHPISYKTTTVAFDGSSKRSSSIRATAHFCFPPGV